MKALQDGIIPGIEEYFYNEITHEYHKVDSNAMNRTLEDLEYLPLPGIMTIYLPGLDGYSHLMDGEWRRPL